MVDLSSQRHSRVALEGLGGVGKTQIAIEWAYRIRQRCRRLRILWIHASNTARVEQAYGDIAAYLRLPGHDDPKVDIMRLVCRWLADARNGPWLLVLDNADDADVFFGTSSRAAAHDAGGAQPQSRTLASFLPQAPHGAVLVTSRNREAAYQLTGDADSIVKVELMQQHDAVALLGARMKRRVTTGDGADELVAALGFIPLAISQAAAYIRIHEHRRMTVRDYTALLSESEERVAHLLHDKAAADLRRDASMPHAVFKTWQLSFDQIRRSCPHAAHVLALMSVFDRQGIPESLLSDGMDKLDFEEAAATLENFSLVRSQVDRNTFEVHRLVHLATRIWLERAAELEKQRVKALRVMERAFPAVKYESWATCQRLLPHAEAVLAYAPADASDQLKGAAVRQSVAHYLRDAGNYAAAVQLLAQDIRVRQELQGPEHPETLKSMTERGRILERLGEYSTAADIHSRVLGMRKSSLGAHHRDTLKSMAYLAGALFCQGNFSAAEAMQREVLEIMESTLGAEHPDTLQAAWSFAGSLYRQGKHKVAESLYQRVFGVQQKTLGPEHPSTLKALLSLSASLYPQGKYTAVEDIERQTCNARVRVYGQEQPDTSDAIHSLALTLIELDKYTDAEATVSQTLGKILGSEHPTTLYAVNVLAFTLAHAGKYNDAEAMARKIAEAREKLLGEEHPYTLRIKGLLASILLHQGKPEAAELLNRQVLEAYGNTLGLEHPDALQIADQLASALWCTGKRNEAADQLRQVVEARQRVLGSEHPDTRLSMHVLHVTLPSLIKRETADDGDGNGGDETARTEKRARTEP